MTDEERIRRAVKKGGSMLGPVERERCSKHPRRRTSYRWIWDVGGDISGADVTVVRSCADCLEEDPNASIEDL